MEILRNYEIGVDKGIILKWIREKEVVCEDVNSDMRCVDKGIILKWIREKEIVCEDVNSDMRWGPCPHSMARPQVADGGTASSYGG
jgi:hypothetical protein